MPFSTSVLVILAKAEDLRLPVPLQVPPAVLSNPNEVWMHLPVTASSYEKLRFPGAT